MRAFLICLLGVALAGAQSPPEPWRFQAIVHVDRSPHARLRGVPVRAVRMGDGFWSSRLRINVERSIPTLLALLEQHGIVDNFRRVSGRKQVERRGPLYTDSDIYKWMEAAAFVLQSGDRPDLRAAIDRLTEEIVAAQEPSGYLNTYYAGDRADKRFTEMYRSHELYCLGHLLQAAIAYYRATGDRKLLDSGIRFANYLAGNFGPQKQPALTGHPELEMALVELYRTTGDKRYLDFAGYLLSGVERERLKLQDSQLRYMFSGKPFTSRTQLEGHAVRAMYACSGAADYFLDSGDPAYRKTLETLWRDMVAHKLYITGGVGSRASGEAFGEPYELPNAQAYTESCAAIGNFMWNWRMLMATGEARFADMMERALYNGINSGMSLSGTLYCYRNPLESNGEKIRNEWYDTTCCPPNLERTLAALPGYLYSTSADGVYVNFYHNSDLDWRLWNGAGLKLRQSTGYPWSNSVEIIVSPEQAAQFSVYLRIPAWSARTRLNVNGEPVSPAPKPGEYFQIRRLWKPGDRVSMSVDMTPRLTQANPRVRENIGRVAVERGPLVYCLEQMDQSGERSIFDASLPAGSGQEFQAEFRRDLLDGVLVLRHPGIFTESPLSDEPLYQPFPKPARKQARAELIFVPYYAWANRGPSAMQVWIPVAETR
ncbi:MAG: glycoside hydrolase family 127 protein [Acidobacteria bacterium]|nr:glycoside hydrolase family 127 protein [Acidobacteriota bacterium]